MPLLRKLASMSERDSVRSCETAKDESTNVDSIEENRLYKLWETGCTVAVTGASTCLPLEIFTTEEEAKTNEPASKTNNHISERLANLKKVEVKECKVNASRIPRYTTLRLRKKSNKKTSAHVTESYLLNDAEKVIKRPKPVSRTDATVQTEDFDKDELEMLKLLKSYEINPLTLNELLQNTVGLTRGDINNNERIINLEELVMDDGKKTRDDEIINPVNESDIDSDCVNKVLEQCLDDSTLDSIPKPEQSEKNEMPVTRNRMKKSRTINSAMGIKFTKTAVTHLPETSQNSDLVQNETQHQPDDPKKIAQETTQKPNIVPPSHVHYYSYFSFPNQLWRFGPPMFTASPMMNARAPHTTYFPMPSNLLPPFFPRGPGYLPPRPQVPRGPVNLPPTQVPPGQEHLLPSPNFPRGPGNLPSTPQVPPDPGNLPRIPQGPRGPGNLPPTAPIPGRQGFFPQGANQRYPMIHGLPPRPSPFNPYVMQDPRPTPIYSPNFAPRLMNYPPQFVMPQPNQVPG